MVRAHLGELNFLHLSPPIRFFLIYTFVMLAFFFSSTYVEKSVGHWFPRRSSPLAIVENKIVGCCIELRSWDGQ